jgi:hypothetical protein
MIIHADEGVLTLFLRALPLWQLLHAGMRVDPGQKLFPVEGLEHVVRIVTGVVSVLAVGVLDVSTVGILDVSAVSTLDVSAVSTLDVSVGSALDVSAVGVLDVSACGIVSIAMVRVFIVGADLLAGADTLSLDNEGLT